jgi:imidazolonepropionase-like amidohydrolase
MKKIILTAIIIAFSLTSMIAEQDKVILIKDGKILTMDGREIITGSVLVKGEKISAVGKNVAAPDKAKVINAKGKLIMPGFIDAYTALGLIEIPGVPVSVDYDEATNPSTPQMRVIDGLNPTSELIPITRVNGITTVLSAPGEGNVFSGQSALINLDGLTVENMIIKFPLALHMNLGEYPKSRYGSKRRMPSTRMGIAALVRQEFAKAQEYLAKKEKYDEELKQQQEHGEKAKEEKKSQPAPPPKDLKLEALCMALTKKVPVIVRAHRVDDIMTAIRLAEEFNLKLILLHATDAYKVVDILAEKNIPVLVGPITTQPASMETLGAIYENAALLAKNGVKIAIVSSSAHGVRNLPYEAGIAVAYGLPKMEALKAITINPAEILEVADVIGSLQKGKIANVIVVQGDPLEITSKVTNVIIKGREIELTNRQIEIYKKCKTKEMP